MRLLQEDDDELEIEINKIDGNTLIELNQFAQECITNSSQKKKKK